MKQFRRIAVFLTLLFGIAAVSVWAQQRADAERVKQRLVGSYKLVSYVGYDQNGVSRRMPYSSGQISYDAAGRMSAQLMGDDRPKFAPGSPASEADRAALYSSYISYYGRYEIDAEKSIVTHHVKGSVSPGMVGSAMPRYYELSADGATLFLSVKNGDRVTGKLQWDRYR